MTVARRYSRQDEFDDIIRAAVARYGNRVTVPIVKAMIARESEFNPKAYREEPHINDASRGLMQVLLKTAQGMGFRGAPEELYLPSVAIDLGVKYISGNVAYAASKGYGLDSALSAYNGGGSKERRGDGKRITNDRNAPFINQAYVDWVKKTAEYFELYEAQKAPAPAQPAGTHQPAILPRLGPAAGSDETGGATVAAAMGSGLLAALAGFWLFFRGGR